MTTTTRQGWDNRIVRYDEAVDPEQLLAHPENARRHPGDQREAIRGSLAGVGWVDVVKVNTTTGHVVDGHARVEEAITAGESVPVLYVELTEDEERVVLATLDPIGALATYDAEVLDGLLDGIEMHDRALINWLSDQRALAVGPPDLGDLADGYKHPDGGTGGGGDGSNHEGSIGLTLWLPEYVRERWIEFRQPFDSDADALEAIMP